MKKVIFTGLFLTLLTSCCINKGSTTNDTVQTNSKAVKTYAVQAKSGTKTRGTATLTEKKGVTTLKLEIHGLTPGIHATHIHEFGDCSSENASTAGGHWNPTNEHHGKWGTHSFHKGDIGNLTADENGTANLVFSTDKWCLECKDPQKNIMGKSIIIHEKDDDFSTQPTGNAGGRVGCIEIK